MKHIFGIQDPIDGHALAVLGRASMHAVIGIFIFELFFAAIGLMFPIHHDENAYDALLIIQLASILSILVITISTTVGCLGLNNREVTAEKYPAALKKLRTKTIWAGALTLVDFHVLLALFSLQERPITESLTSPRQLLQTLLFGIMFCPFMYFFEKKNLKIIHPDV
ncbi:DUF3278 domain-containing protein [Lacticaseibacillus paracasei]|nr:DUF3278 domain-containing protein [Lacticaseibacillus paracasei]